MFGKRKKENGSQATADEKVQAADPGKNREMQEQQELHDALGKIKHKFVVLSGKGGVGKSTVAVNMAVTLASKGYNVGLLDVDIHGPSIPKMLGLENTRLTAEGNKMNPVQYNDKLKVISIGFMLEKGEDPVIWRGPLKYNVIKQFLKDVNWGELDYLVIDSPPGTGDEPLSVCQLIPHPDGAVVVTTPQDVAIIDVQKSISFCNKLNMPVLGVVENMSGFTCPHCKGHVDIFRTGGGAKMSEQMSVPFLGSIPITVEIAEDADAGKPFISTVDDDDAPAKTAFNTIVEKLIK